MVPATDLHLLEGTYCNCNTETRKVAKSYFCGRTNSDALTHVTSRTHRALSEMPLPNGAGASPRDAPREAASE